MSEVAIMAATAKTTLQDIAKQAKALGVGLENAAPLGAKTTTNHAVSYLLTISEVLVELAAACETLGLNRE